MHAVGMYVCMEGVGLPGTCVSAGQAACDVLVSSVPCAELRCAEAPMGEGAPTAPHDGAGFGDQHLGWAEACWEVCGHLCCDSSEDVCYQ